MNNNEAKPLEERLGFGERIQRKPNESVSPMCDCPECASDLVYPVEWEEVEDNNFLWWVKLHCPNCDLVTEGTYAQEEVDHFDESLDNGTDMLAKSLKWITRDIMSEQVENFTYALNNDHVLPEDF